MTNETLRRFRTVPVEFIAKMGCTLQVRVETAKKHHFSCMATGHAPHLLGLLHYYKTGRHRTGDGVPSSVGHRPMSKTISAIDIQEMGIKLTASRMTKLPDMGIKKTLFPGEIFMEPLLFHEIMGRL